MLTRFLTLICVLVLLTQCATDRSAVADQADRPYDPWIVRSVLDEQPRIVTIALHEDLWAAYSAEDCSLYKVWKGYVNFEGAVYNTQHGPQPQSVGDAYVVNAFNRPWRIAAGTAELETQAQYAGHRIRDGRAELMYDLKARDIGPVRVYEQIEYIEDASGQMGFERVFTTESVPDGHHVVLQLNLNSIVSKQSIETDGELTVYEEETQEFGTLQVLELEGHLQLNDNGETRLAVRFVGRPTIRNPYRGADEEDEDLPLGYRLIARSDCKTCHNTNVKTIGPSYVEIAERYPTTESSINMLVNKIITGGTGIWGIQVMSPHPDLSQTDARAMVEYILGLDEDDAGGEPGSTGTIPPEDYISSSAEVNPGELIPGALTQVYLLDRNPRRIPPAPTSRPDMAGIMSDFGNLRNSDFVDLSDNFALYASGFLHVPDTGEYVLRIWSDDGSRFTLNGEVLIDHDGDHGTSSKQVTVGLNAGYHPFLISYYQGGGDKFLSMNWKRPGASLFEVIPQELYLHHPNQQAVLSGLTLPMSSVKRTPGDGVPLTEVHPSYDLSMARPNDFLPKVGGMDFLSDGRLVVCTWDPSGAVYLLSNLEAEDPNDIEVRRIAAGLAEPLGLKVVDDMIYILQKQELTRLVDTDGDELIDEYQTVSNAWRTSANFHEFAFGLEYRDGYFYGTLATAINPGGASTDPQIPDRGKVAKISATDGSVEFVAHGLRTPNGIGTGVDGELFVADNQGDWLPSSKIVHVKAGAWYGSRSVDFEGTAGLTEQKPVVWLPQDEIGNSPSTPSYINDGPYAGQMIHGEVTHGGVKRDFVEKINGEYQGAVFRFIQGLEAGVNRLVWGPDSALYVGGIGNPGNWAQTGKLWYGLQRLKYNGKSTFEILAVRAKSNGVELEFTEPLREGDGWDTRDFDVRQWQYVPTADYGGPKVNEERLRVVSANVSADRQRVFLELAGMKADRVVYVHLLDQYVSAEGGQLWSTEAWYTMNQIPVDLPGARTRPSQEYGPNILTRSEQDAGWKLLFDGKTAEGWKRYGMDGIGDSWVIEDGAWKLDARKNAEGKWYVEDRGDLMTVDSYENFELSLEWKISNCGNSGIIFNVVESEEYDYPWQTGPEMQILDDACHPDSRYPTHRAGDLYDMLECAYVTVKPAGQWNKVRLIKRDGKVEHWLNGVKVVAYEMYTDEWDKMVAASKFAEMEGFGKARRGHIVLQDHGDAQVWFRDIKIREF
ncbi:MAG: family 16 glycoside hydrolase [Saprospiraceae bacterium]|nr:family 16 glycoside hydrolase [Saprospiraceae bacterium]